MVPHPPSSMTEVMLRRMRTCVQITTYAVGTKVSENGTNGGYVVVGGSIWLCPQCNNSKYKFGRRGDEQFPTAASPPPSSDVCDKSSATNRGNEAYFPRPGKSGTCPTCHDRPVLDSRHATTTPSHTTRINGRLKGEYKVETTGTL